MTFRRKISTNVRKFCVISKALRNKFSLFTSHFSLFIVSLSPEIDSEPACRCSALFLREQKRGEESPGNTGHPAS